MKKRYADKLLDLNADSDGSDVNANCFPYLAAHIKRMTVLDHPAESDAVRRRRERRAKKQLVVYDDEEAARVMFRFPMEEFSQVRMTMTT